MSSKLLLFSLFIHGFQTTLVSNLKPHCFHLDSSLKRSSNISNWLSRIPTQSSLVNSELLFFITIQYTISMPSEMSVRRTFRRLLGSLKNYLMKVMRRRGPNMSLLIATFVYQESLKNVQWELIPSTRTVTL